METGSPSERTPEGKTTGGGECTAEGLRYREGAFSLTFTKQPRGSKWGVRVHRGETLLGQDLLTPADAQARNSLLRGLKELTEQERADLDAALLRLGPGLEREWEEYLQQQDRQERQRQQRAADEARARHEEQRERWLREAGQAAAVVLDDMFLLYRIGRTIKGLGVIGEQCNALLLHLAAFSQITDKPISVVVKGDPSGGKSHLVAQVLSLFPDESHIDLTSVSEKALIYDERDYAHKTVVIYEMHGSSGEMASYVIRTLISEGAIRHQTVEVTSEGPVGRLIVKEGPTNFITTTTLPELHAENETRIWTLLVDDSDATTKAVLEIQADIASGTFRPVDVAGLRNAFEWMRAAGARQAVVPFAKQLAQGMPTRPLRLRRDFPRLLQLVQACALLHQRQRGRDDQGRVIATLADYAMARELVAAVFEQSVTGLTKKTTDLVQALAEVLDGRKPGADLPSYSDLVGKTGKPKTYISRWLRPALELGLVDNVHAGQKGKPAALKRGHYRLDDSATLPTVTSLADQMRTDVQYISPLTGKVFQYRFSTTETVVKRSPPPQSVERQGDEFPKNGKMLSVSPFQSGETPINHTPPSDDMIDIPPEFTETLKRSGYFTESDGTTY
jgi:hypothetical protein